MLQKNKKDKKLILPFLLNKNYDSESKRVETQTNCKTNVATFSVTLE